MVGRSATKTLRSGRQVKDSDMPKPKVSPSKAKAKASTPSPKKGPRPGPKSRTMTMKNTSAATASAKPSSSKDKTQEESSDSEEDSLPTPPKGAPGPGRKKASPPRKAGSPSKAPISKELLSTSGSSDSEDDDNSPKNVPKKQEKETKASSPKKVEVQGQSKPPPPRSREVLSTSGSDSEDDDHSPKNTPKGQEKETKASSPRKVEVQSQPPRPRGVLVSTSGSDSDGDEARHESEEETERDHKEHEVAPPKAPSNEKAKRAEAYKAKKDSMKEEEDELKMLGMNVFASMQQKDIENLFERLSSKCSPRDTVRAKNREGKIDWKEVAFGQLEARECQAVWVYLRSHARDFRIMHEIVTEIRYKLSEDKSFQSQIIETLPGFPVKPPCNGFAYFNREMWGKEKATHGAGAANYVKFQRDCRERYLKLPEEEKKTYDQQAELAEAEYKRLVKQFFNENPGVAQYMASLKNKEREEEKAARKGKRNDGNGSRSVRVKKEIIDPYEDAPQPPQKPARMFMNSKLNQVQPPPMNEDLTQLKHHYFEKWKKLSDKKLGRWVDAAIQAVADYYEQAKEYQKTHPGYSIPEVKFSGGGRSFLTPQEVGAWEFYKKKPVHPKSTSQDLFVNEYLLSDKHSELPEEERKAKANEEWNTVDWYTKEMYTMKYKMQSVQYRKEIQDFFATIPTFMKPICLHRIHKKYHKALEEVDKVPPTADNYVHSESDGIFPDFPSITAKDEPPSPKKKKRKRAREEAPDETADTESVVLSEGEDDESAPPKKKKKKKKHTDYGEMESRAIIHGMANNETRRMVINADDEEVATLDQDPLALDNHRPSPSSRQYTPNTSVTKRDIFEAVRGIFDARVKGRFFSVFYYYAKHVAHEKFWIDAFTKDGLESTALQIIKTFLGLPVSQKEIFLKQSEKYHQTLRQPDQAPTEPAPPPRFAGDVYKQEVRKSKNPNSKWALRSGTYRPFHSLPDNVQMMYTKKLYHETKLYMRRYEAYISSLSPSDLVHFAIQKYKDWEVSMYTKQSLAAGLRRFVFQMTAQKDQELAAEQPDKMNVVPAKYLVPKNPLVNNDKLIKKRTKEILHKKGVQASVIDPEDSDEEAFSLYTLKDPHKLKVKLEETYNYPLDDMFETPKQNERPSRRIKTNQWGVNIRSQGTQTIIVVYTEISSQTEDNDNDIPSEFEELNVPVVVSPN